MRGKIVFTQIRLSFNDFPNPNDAPGLMHQQLSQQFAGDQGRVAVIKLAGQFLHAPMLGQIPGLTRDKMFAQCQAVSVASVAQMVRAWDS